MASRGDFFGIAAVAPALTAGGPVAAGPGLAAPASGMQSGAGQRSGHYVPPVKFGLGGVPLGNEFEVITDEEAYKTLDAAWNAGVRYYDVSPWYGLGLAERRFGQFLHSQNREAYVISSKVGKLLKASKKAKKSNLFPLAGSPNIVEFNYSAAGVRRSIEDSLQRLGIDSLDIVFVHDLSPDNKYLDGKWLEHFEIAK